MLRPVTADDDAFLFKVYAGTRAEEMAMTDWLPVQQTAFLKMQFKLQKNGYESQFPNAEHVIINFKGVPIGRMMVDRTMETEIHGVDIALLPESRGAGVGSYLVKNLLEEARAAGVPFRIQVEHWNHRAIQLYDRLGFARTGESPTHVAMEWTPKPAKRRAAKRR